jgi:hypothetical protein
MFRLWIFVPALLVLAMFVSLFVLVVSLAARSNVFPFVPMCRMYGLLYGQFDSEHARMQHEEMQRQEEDFKPFVFKDQVQQREQA